VKLDLKLLQKKLEDQLFQNIYTHTFRVRISSTSLLIYFTVCSSASLCSQWRISSYHYSC